ncbi:hypothetical protein [uncultured Alsobacter sp.]|uniref:hypothetical protein n=1 Tax=uncultured Alsobacter sp. TaxID=1748258 RepID=UPI0025F2214A|nr:hypothetical protein [uncultured Alsobacter sp.]
MAFLFERPPLIPGESEREWRGLLTGLADSLQPATVVDWLRLRDVVNGIWEALRLERFRDTLIALQRDQAAADLFEGLLRSEIKDPDARRAAAQLLARGWIAGKVTERREGERLLDRAGLRAEAVEAAAFLGQMDVHERLDRMRRRAEAARDAGLPAAGSQPQPAGADLVIEAEVVPPPRRLPRRQASPPASIEAVAEAVDATAADEPAKAKRAKAPRAEAPAPEPQPDLFGMAGGVAA